MADTLRIVVADRGVDPTAREEAPFRRRAAVRWRLPSHERDFLRAAHRGQWKALDATGICSGSTVHARFQEWRRAGLFERLWALGLEEYDAAKGIDWEWLAMDGATTKAPSERQKKWPKPDR